jgi:hypothetical protein
MSHRLAHVLAIAVAVGLVAGCVSAAAPSPAGTPTTRPTVGPSEPPDVVPTTPPGVAPEPVPSPEASPAEPTALPEEGNVEDLPMGPVLSVESIGKRSVRVTLDDLDAKAWRIVVAGTGDLANDRLRLTVETSDVAPLISVVETSDGQVVDRIDLSGFGDPTATAGLCHPTLGVCVDADAIRLPANGDGRLVVELERTADGSVSVTGATAGWPGEPFILGPWSTTESFPWEPAVAF